MSHSFRRLAGSFHYEIKSFADLQGAASVPEAHWIATACPTTGMQCDPKFLTLLDADGNGRIRPEELKAGIKFLAQMLKTHDNVTKGSDVLTLDHLSADGAPFRETALYVLRGLQVVDQSKISLAQVRSIAEVQTKVSANGDGIITTANTSDPALQALITDIMAVLPAVTDKSGEKGVDQALVKAFGDAVAAAVAWLDGTTTNTPWGADSVAAARHILAVKAKVDEYFLQCRLVAAQPSAAERFKLSPEKVDALMGDVGALRTSLDSLPLAPPDARGVLSWSTLHRGAAYESMKALEGHVRAILGDKAATGLTESDWAALTGTAGGIVAWADTEGTLPALKLGADKLRAVTADQLAALDKACQEDAAVSDTLGRVNELERLILYQRWLFELANNFIAMPFLYDANRHALYEQGELVIAGRNFPFSTLVENRGAHSGVALQSSCFLLYVNVTGGGKSFDVCVPVTAGTGDGLYVGRRGVFTTLEGQEMDAIITQVITNPVSIYEAITSPFNRIVTFVEARIQAWADKSNADFDSAVNKNLDSAQAATGKVVDDAKAAASAPPPTAPAAKAEGETSVSPAMLVGAGSIIGSLGLVVGSVIGALAGLSVFQLILAFLSLLGIIAAPFALLAWLKLRRRNLAAVLEAAGWALNEPLKLNRDLGLLFTYRPPRPAGSTLDWVDGAAALAKGRSAESEEDPEDAKAKARVRFWIKFLIFLGLVYWLGGKLWTVAQPFLPALMG